MTHESQNVEHDGEQSDTTIDTRRARAEARDETLLELLAEGFTHTEAARLARCSTKTVQRRLGDDDFARELAQRRAVRLSDMTGRLSRLTDEAINAVEDTLHVDNPTLRLRAALALLNLRLRVHDEYVNERRLARLEQEASQRPSAEEFPKWTTTQKT